MLKYLIVTLALLLSTAFAIGQQGTINHGVYLRADPSTKHKSLSTLTEGTSVTLIDRHATTGFYHVKTAEGSEGWVGAKYVDVQRSANSRLMESTSGLCHASLWDHVYHPVRLIKEKNCISVTGQFVDASNGKRKDGVRHEGDGDTHGWLKLDPGNEQLLNAGNMSDENGNLVFEVICKYRVTQTDANGKQGCLGYKSALTLPPVGSHVRITGTYVQDTEHAKWMEIHPVTSITVIP